MTKKRSGRPTQPPPLRQQAEERWKRTRAGRPPLVPEDHQAVVYELEVHQIELEIQNEELRAAQVELAKARDSYLDLYDFAPVGYLTLDDHRVIRQANLTAATLLGVERQKLIGTHLERFVATEERDTLYLHLQAALASPASQSCSLNLFRPDKSGFFARLESTAVAPRREETARYRVVLTDVSAAHETAVALRESEAKLRAAFENAPCEFWVRDAEGRCIAQNAAVAKHWGEQIGKRVDDTAVPQDVAAVWQANNRRAFAGEVVEGDVEHVCDGQRRVYHAVVAPFRVDGEVRGVLGFNIDITDRKRAENALRELNETLEQRVTERTEAIQVLHDVASVANQLQDPAQAVEQCLHRLTRYNGWCFGHALLRAGDDPNVLIAASVCYPEDHDRFCRFREATLAMRFSRGEGLAGRVFASGKPAWSTHLRRDLVAPRAAIAKDLGIRTALAFPVLVGEEAAAVLEFFSDKVLQPDERIIDVLADVGMQLGRVLERAKFQEHLLAIPEEIQRAFAQDLHDDVGQEMTGLGLKAQTLAEMLTPPKTPAARLAADIAATVNRTRTKLHGLSRRLLPIELEQGLLAVALGQLVAAVNASSRIACTFANAHPNPIFDSRATTHLYRIAQEAVSNALRHSGARSIQITLAQEHGETALRIEDDGTGLLREGPQATGMGLQTMRYRAGLIGGKLEVGPGLRGGASVVCRLPPKSSPDRRGSLRKRRRN